MDFILKNIEAYALAHTSEESELLQKLNRETHAKVLYPRMLSGQMQGRFLAMVSRMMRPQHILEIGTYTGYATHCLAEGLTEDGVLTTIEVNEELEVFTRSFLEKSDRYSQINLLIGSAINIIPSLDFTFDIVFIDADKLNYSNYYDLVINKVRTGGVIIADNVLWSGKVVETTRKPDKDTQALLDFNQKIQEDSRVINALLPFRDGLMMIQKL